MERERLVHADRSPSRCPYCKDSIEASGAIVACEACGARHHQSCHKEHGACATCGSQRVLVSPARAAAARDRPPLAGSTIRVAREGERTIYEWPVGVRADYLMVLLLTCLVVTAPIALYILSCLLRQKSERIVIEGDEIEVAAYRTSGLSSVERRRFRRGDIGTIRVDLRSALTFDVGIESYGVRTSVLTPSLRGAELAWLAERLTAWRDEA